MPLLIVQRNVALVPAAMPVMVVLGLVVLVITAVPDCTVHKPVPTTAVFAVIANVLVEH